jgi:hypothetical protein
MNPKRVIELCTPLMLLKFFPPDPEARTELLLMIGRMASNEDQVRWLVNRMLNLYDEWTGPRTLRAVFCQKFKPADGEDLRTAICPGYPEGLPSEKPEPQLLALPPGHVASADPELEAMVGKLVEDMPKIPASAPLTESDARFDRLLKETLTAPADRPLPPVPTNPNYRPITQEDVDRAVMQLHEGR